MIRSYTFIFLCLFLFSACQNLSNSDLTKTLTLPNEHKIWVPDGFFIEKKQGIDSQVGRLYSEDLDDFEMTYDIGYLAGMYVDETDENAIITNAGNTKLYYETRLYEYDQYPNCCTVFTFEIKDEPVNFIGYNNDYLELMIDIMKSFEEAE